MHEVGKFLAWVLRHEPHAIGLDLDREGWASIQQLLVCVTHSGRALSRAQLDACVANDSKGRFVIDSTRDRIRATQGHSIAVDLGLTPTAPPAVLFHGTPSRFVDAILANGLDRRARHAVHLSVDVESAIDVGNRRGRPVVLRVDAAAMARDGYEFRRSDNGVWLTERVPPAYLCQVLATPEVSGNEPAVPEPLHLDLLDARVAALAWGSPTGQPVLALHGWLDNAASFVELAPRLCAALDLRVVALDLPGHGHSEHKRAHYHFIDAVADTVFAADALGWDQFSLLGHSMGAGISTLVAGTIPERIAKCVLLEGLGPMVDEPSQAPRRLARSLRVESRKQDKQKRLFPDPETAVERLLEAASMKPESARHLVARGLEQRDGGWAWRADPRLRVDSRLRLSEAHVDAFLAAIRAPVLLVSADRGWPHDPAVAQRRMDAVANLTHVTLAGHHHVHLDEPDAVAAAIVPFWGSA